MNNKYRIAFYPGDGIGVEVTREARKVLDAAQAKFGFMIDATEFPWGCKWALANNCGVVPDDYLDQLRPFDAVYLGALGNPALVPDHTALVPLLEMRQAFEQYVGLRPAKLFPGVSTPLANKQTGDIDIFLVRENSEGEYIKTGGKFKAGTPDEISVQTAIHTRKGVTRILRYAFEAAKKRSGRLAMATKSNVLTFGMVMWDDIFEEMKLEFPEVKAEKFHVDALVMHFVRTPERFDVVVASNLFGDILSDLAGALVGSLGLAASACINPEHDHPSLFEPVHGSAPDIAGQEIANPLAAIRSAAMMLDFLGETEAAQAIEQAIIDNLAEGTVKTPDLGGTASTADVGDDIVTRIS
jgi:tartrate dehydrogenase/decarboxylase/D-malate dehydrogenase